MEPFFQEPTSTLGKVFGWNKKTFSCSTVNNNFLLLQLNYGNNNRTFIEITKIVWLFQQNSVLKSKQMFCCPSQTLFSVAEIYVLQ